MFSSLAACNVPHALALSFCVLFQVSNAEWCSAVGRDGVIAADEENTIPAILLQQPQVASKFVWILFICFGVKQLQTVTDENVGLVYSPLQAAVAGVSKPSQHFFMAQHSAWRVWEALQRGEERHIFLEVKQPRPRLMEGQEPWWYPSGLDSLEQQTVPRYSGTWDPIVSCGLHGARAECRQCAGPALLST